MMHRQRSHTEMRPPELIAQEMVYRASNKRGAVPLRTTATQTA
jgi:hypothetical protein